jgi:hypothetical protein
LARSVSLVSLSSDHHFIVLLRSLRPWEHWFSSSQTSAVSTNYYTNGIHWIGRGHRAGLSNYSMESVRSLSRFKELRFAYSVFRFDNALLALITQSVHRRSYWMLALAPKTRSAAMLLGSLIIRIFYSCVSRGAKQPRGSVLNRR